MLELLQWFLQHGYDVCFKQGGTKNTFNVIATHVNNNAANDKRIAIYGTSDVESALADIADQLSPK